MFFKLTTPLHKWSVLSVLTLLIGMILVELGRSEVSEIYRIKAVNAADKKDYETAEAFLLAALAIDKNNKTLYLDLGNLYHNFSEQSPSSLEILKKSRQAYLSAIEINQFYAKAWLGLAWNREKIHQVSSSYQRPKKLSDDTKNLPGTELDSPDWIGETENYFLRAMALDPNNIFYMLNYVSFLTRIERFDEAKALYRKAYKISPAVINQYYAQNRALNRVVEEYYWEEINKNPKKLEFYYHLGRWYFSQGLYAHSLAVYYKARTANKTSGLLSEDQKMWGPQIDRLILNVELALRKKRHQ
jgi:tetratricopeptide (TPR) repeat protein